MALGRGKSEEEVRKVAKGRAWTGQDALQHGLVDALGGLDKAIHLAKAEAQLPLQVTATDCPCIAVQVAFLQWFLLMLMKIERIRDFKRDTVLMGLSRAILTAMIICRTERWTSWTSVRL